MDVDHPLVAHLLKRFPLLHDLGGCFGCCLEEDLAPFLGLLLCLAERNMPEKQACCVVLPEAIRISQLFAVLLSLERLKSNFHDYVSQYAKHQLKEGEKVRILPTGHVYEYRGLWPERPSFFRLASTLLSKTSQGTRTFPVKEIVRLETTAQKTPRGGLKTKLDEPCPALIDKMLCITTYGNNSIYANDILFLGSKRDFQNMLEETFFFKKLGNVHHTTLESFMPWGGIDQEGKLRLLSPKEDVGTPLVAVSSYCEDVAAACENAEPFTKTVIASSPAKLASNLQCFDNITDRQNLLIFSDRSRLDELRVLHERGVVVWEMSPQEIIFGRTTPDETARESYLGAVIRSADIMSKLVVNTCSCGTHLPGKFAQLIQLVLHSGKEDDNNDLLKELTGRIWDVLMMVSELFMPPEKDDLILLNKRAEALSTEYSGKTMFLEQRIRGELRECITELHKVMNGNPTELGKHKGDLLLKKLSENVEKFSVAVVTPSSRGKASLELLMEGADLSDIPCFQVGNYPERRDFDKVILAAWPGAQRVARIFNRYNAREICLVGYEHELVWFDSFLRRREQEMRFAHQDTSKKEFLTGINGELLPGAGRVTAGLQREEHRSDYSLEIEKAMRSIRPAIPKGDDLREVRFARFFESSWAYLTEGHKVPCVNTLMEPDIHGKRNISMKTAEDIRTGDYLLFHGDRSREIIEGFARHLEGNDEYDNHRKNTKIWKEALPRIGTTAETIRSRLSAYGLKRTVATIRNWLDNDQSIGPYCFSDLQTIAKACRYALLDQGLNQVWDSILKVRGFHQRAGSELTKILLDLVLKQQLNPSGKEIRIDLVIGEIWVVQVDYLGENLEKCPSSLANRLMWDDNI